MNDSPGADPPAGGAPRGTAKPDAASLEAPLTRHAGIEVPLVCGAMYPCSNPELVAAVSEAGGIGIVQPLSLTFVHGHRFRDGLRLIRSMTSKPFGMNALIERSSRAYMDRMRHWVDVAIEEGVRFFVTSLGNPRWVADRAHAAGGFVYHDVTEAKWAARGLEGGVDGLIAVNARAGGHAGPRSAEALLEELRPFGVPVVAAGGVGDAEGFAAMLRLGYAGVQMGTRFIATPECRASEAYKRAIVAADEADVVWTERLTGLPVAVLHTPYVRRVGTRAGAFERWMLRGRRRKHWMRTWYAMRSGVRLRHDSLATGGRPDYWQAGKSVAAIRSIEPAGDIVRACGAALRPR